MCACQSGLLGCLVATPLFLRPGPEPGEERGEGPGPEPGEERGEEPGPEPGEEPGEERGEERASQLPPPWVEAGSGSVGRREDTGERRKRSGQRD